MGAGKTTAAAALAEVLGTAAVDADSVIEERARARRSSGCSPSDGEPAFRAAEEAVTLELLGDAGAPGARRSAAARSAPSACARRSPRTSWSGSTSTSRPPGRAASGRRTGRSLATAAPVRRAVRRARADLRSARRCDRARRAARARWPGARRARGAARAGSQVLWATSASGDYPVYIGAGLLGRAGSGRLRSGGRRFLVTDGTSARLYGDAARAARRPTPRSCPASSPRRWPTPRSCGPSWRATG